MKKRCCKTCLYFYDIKDYEDVNPTWDGLCWYNGPQNPDPERNTYYGATCKNWKKNK